MRLRLKLGPKKYLDLNIGEVKRDLWIFYVADVVSYLAIAVYGVMLTAEIFSDEANQTDMFKYTVGFVVVLLASIMVKVVFGGLKFWPESKFDIYTLLALIGLISGLLIKQLFDLTNEGMFPNSVSWQFTIWGLLVLFLLHYLFDVIVRNGSALRLYRIAMPLVLEFFLLLELISEKDINSQQAMLVMVVLPLYGLLAVDAKKMILKIVGFGNAILLSVLVFLNLDLDFLLAALATAVVLDLLMVYLKVVNIREFIGSLRKSVESVVRKKSVKGISKIWEGKVLSLALFKLPFVLLIALVVDLLAGGRLALVSDSAESIFNGAKDFDKLYTFLIGGVYNLYGLTSIGVIIESYGVVGLLLFVVMFGYVLISLVRNMRSLQKKKAPTEELMVYAALFSVVIMAVLISFLVVLPTTVMVFVFMILGLIAASFAKEKGSVLQSSLLSLSKLDKRKKLYFRAGQYLVSLLIIVFVVLMISNIEDVFLK